MLFAYFSASWLRSGQTLAMKTWRIRLVGKVNNVIVVVKVFVVLAVIACGIMYIKTANWVPFIPENTGEFIDHFGHPVTVLAVANGAVEPRRGVMQSLPL